MVTSLILAVAPGPEAVPEGAQQGRGQLRRGELAVQQPAPGFFEAFKTVIIGAAGGRDFLKGPGLPLGHEPPEIQAQDHGLGLVDAQHGVQSGAQHRQIARHAAHVQKGLAEIGRAELHDPRGAHGCDIRPDRRVEPQLVVHEILGNSGAEQGEFAFGLGFHGALHGHVSAFIQPPPRIGQHQDKAQQGQGQQGFEIAPEIGRVAQIAGRQSHRGPGFGPLFRAGRGCSEKSHAGLPALKLKI